MHLYYALGGGLGHLTRATMVIDALGLAGDAALLSASPFARDPRVTGGLPVVEVPRALGRDRIAFRAWIERTLRNLSPAELIVDSFPGGILGELCGVDVRSAVHIARRLRWGVYAPRLTGPVPRFRVTFTVEALAPAHERWLREASARLERLRLPARRGAAASGPLVRAPYWLVVHSGPDHETVDLVRYAAELRAIEKRAAPIAVISPACPSWLPAGAAWREVYPAFTHFEHAERIITAAGFNAIRETEPVRERHWCIPYERRLDDQFGRAAAARRLRRQAGVVR
jgi:hypothetical protein